MSQARFHCIIFARRTCRKKIGGYPPHSPWRCFLVTIKRIIIPGCFLLSTLAMLAQDSSVAAFSNQFEYATVLKNNDALMKVPVPAITDKKKLVLVTGGNIICYGGSLIILNSAWYKNYPHTSFHTFNDGREWLQLDKSGHGWTAYNTGRASAAVWKWAGLSPRQSAIIGGLSGATYLTAIEFLDAHSSKWGWSWSDMFANVVGSGVFTGQQLLWNEQRIQVKFSFHHKSYGEPVLTKRADDLFGKPWYERMLKDYNAQTYWISVNLASFSRGKNIPAWLNVAVGYGADGMFGGFENKWLDGDPGFPINRTDIPRKRQFYIAPDIDFTRIATNKKWVKTIFFCLNAFKMPAPSLMIDSKGNVKAYLLYF